MGSLLLDQGCVVPLDLAFACCLRPVVFWLNFVTVAQHVFRDCPCVRLRIGIVLATAQTIPLLTVETTTIVQTVSSNQMQLYKDSSTPQRS